MTERKALIVWFDAENEEVELDDAEFSTIESIGALTIALHLAKQYALNEDEEDDEDVE